ncbi:MAG: SBBP repeat-containing protein [bacterium]
MKKLSLPIVLMILLIISSLHAEVTEEWVVGYIGPQGTSSWGYDVEVDPAGNVYIAARCSNYGAALDMATVKYDFSGEMVWEALFNGPLSYCDEAWSVGVDPNGNVFTTGITAENYGWPEEYYDIATVMYNENGAQQWYDITPGSASGLDCAFEILVDDNGSCYVTGYCSNSGTYMDYTTIKYDVDGNLRWVNHYDGGFGSSDMAFAMALDEASNVYVTGRSYRESNNDIVTLKYNADGLLLWEAVYDGGLGLSETGWDVAVDQNGNVYVTGDGDTDTTSYDEEFITLKYDPVGNLLWSAIYDGLGSDDDEYTKLAIDQNGNVFVTGRSKNSAGDFDYATIKYSTDGDVLWVRHYDAQVNESDSPSDICADAEGNVYVTGRSNNGSGSLSGYDFLTIRYDADGTEAWIMRWDGPTASRDEVEAMTIDQMGNVYVTGMSLGFGTAVVKYCQYIPNVDIELTYVAGSPVPPNGGNLYFEVVVDNLETFPVNYDAWLAVCWEGNDPETIVHRAMTEFQPGWQINRPDMWFPVPWYYAGGSYEMIGAVGIHPDIIWDESRFTFTKSGDYSGDDFKPTIPDAEFPNPFDDESKTTTFPIQNADQFVMHGNYPNPFNPTTNFSFAIPQADHVTLKVFNLQGQLVETLVDGLRDAGSHHVTFDS